ncbi:MAG TPA: class I SAM-dependent methyltransferase [Thermomicrobiales bacterium]|nr:class I SAM-dependent methyltransferase [Thermomicrobiales bacterium]
MSLRREAELQYLTTDPLKVRIETHQRYSERLIDLEAESAVAFALISGESILDVGCGTGAFLSYLRRNGSQGRLVGLDRSDAMIAEAAREPSIEWTVGDVERLPFTDGEFDRVSARHMLYYIDDLQSALCELARVTKPNGLFLATTNAARSTPLIDDLYLDLLAAFGLPRRQHAAGEFHTETALAALSTVWPHVEDIILDNACIFTSSEPIVRYVATLLPSVDGADSDMRVEMLNWLEREAASRLAVLGGIWRDPKIVGIYRCRR